MQCHGLQCGFCTPGMMITARALLDRDARPRRGHHPRGHLRTDLPVHRLHHDRALHPVGGQQPTAGDDRGHSRPAAQTDDTHGPRRGRSPDRSREHVMTTLERPPSETTWPTTTRSRAGTAGCCARRTRGSSAAAATTSTTSACPACCTWRSCARRTRTPGSSASTSLRHRHIRRSRPSSPAPTSPRRGWRGCRPCPTTCRPCWPPTRCGSRARRWRSSSPRTATRRATRWNSSTSSTTRSIPSSTRARRSIPTPPVIRTDLEGKTDNHCFDWETGDAAATEAAFAKADVVVKQEIVYPRVHPAPMETCGAVADLDPVTGKLTLWSTSRRRRTRTARCTRWWPGCPSTRSGSSRPTSAAASATRCRSTLATCARSSGRWCSASRSSGWRTAART